MPISNMEFTRSFNDYRGVQTFFLPSPPPSASPVSSPPGDHFDDPPHIIVRSDSTINARSNSLAAYRRRCGRGGRIMVDRKNLPLRPKDDIDELVLDRFKYDNFQDEFLFEYPVDINSTP